ncbi:hypothetical protein PR048_020478 [Dryococelus australis]|uniref:Uncharacterized protein n=1 Tax=Dryococelus australis TaxID=614101 RepID=A0ABQ9H6L3_9NEOP|nr:hypothetical protein PR048_020478 [Dryococelus australis]
MQEYLDLLDKQTIHEQLKNFNMKNLLEDSLGAQRSIYDADISAGSVKDITITKLINSAFRNGSAKRNEVFKKRKAGEEIRVLELKKKDILQQAKYEAEALEGEVRKLKQVLN